MQNIGSQENNEFFGTAWSLSIEEWFYLLFPLALFFLQFVIKSKRRALLIVIVLFLVLPLLGRIVLAFNPNITWDAGFHKITLIRLDAIGMGVLCAFTKYYYNDFWLGNKRSMAFAGIVIGIMLLVVYYYKYIVFHNPVTGEQYADPGFFLKTFMLTILSFAIALAMPLLYTLKVKSSNYISRVITFISLVSYSLYLLHPLVILFVMAVLKPLDNMVRVTEVWTISFAIAYLQYRFFETELTALRNKFGEKTDAITVGRQTAMKAKA